MRLSSCLCGAALYIVECSAGFCASACWRLVASPRCGSQKCPQAMPNVPGEGQAGEGAKITPVENCTSVVEAVCQIFPDDILRHLFLCLGPSLLKLTGKFPTCLLCWVTHINGVLPNISSLLCLGLHKAGINKLRKTEFGLHSAVCLPALHFLEVGSWASLLILSPLLHLIMVACLL